MKYVKISGRRIPKFKGTHDAVAFGKEATPSEVAEMKKLWKRNLKAVKKLRGEKKLGEAFELAFEGQFLREAIEMALGTFPGAR